MLSSDGEIVLMHDHFLDRTTDGSGLVAKTTLEDIRGLDAGSWFGGKFAGERVPTLHEAVEHASKIGLGLVVEIKEFLDLPRLTERLAELLDETDANDVAIFISFDHVVAASRLKERLPGDPHRRNCPRPPRRHRRALRSAAHLDWCRHRP